MDNNIKKKIGQRINSALASADMKQKELAKILGVTDNTISYYASGSRVPNYEQLIKIASALNVSTDYILGVTDVKSTDISVQSICKFTGLSEKAVDLLHGFISTFDYGYNRIINYIIESEEKAFYNDIGYDVAVDMSKRLLHSIWHYFHASKAKHEDTLHITISGRLKEQIDYNCEKTTDWNDRVTEMEIKANDIIDRVLLDRIIENLKMCKQDFQKCFYNNSEV